MSKKQNKAKLQSVPNTGRQSATTTSSGSAGISETTILAACLVLTFAVFANTLSAGFVNWDDHGYLWLNPLVQPLSGQAISEMFTGHTCGNYSPLVVFSYCIEHGFDNIVKPGAMVADNFNPFTYHFTNVLLHLGATTLAFFFFKALGLRSWALGFATALFGIHPMRCESVAWVTERKDVLYGLFYIGALLTYWKYLHEQSGKTKWYLITLGLGVLSYFSKIQAVSLPLSMLCLDYLAGRNIKSFSVWFEKAPYWILSLVFGLVGLHFLEAAEGLKDTGYPLTDRLFFATYSLCAYLWKLVAPFGLSAYYPYPAKGALPAIYYATPLVLAGVGWWVWRSAKYGKEIVFGFLFFLVNIMFVLQFKGAGKAFMADRFTYIPYLGLFFILAKKYADAAEGKLGAGLQTALPYLAGGFLALCAFLTFKQNQTWQSSLTLWDNVTQKHPGDALSWNNYGLAYLDLDDAEKALPIYEKALKADPNHFDALFNMGVTLNKLKRYKEAIQMYDRALAVKPDYPDAFFSRGQVYINANETEKAVADFQKALALGFNKPKHEIMAAIGNAYNTGKQFDKAAAAYDEAIKEKPDADYHFKKGNALAAGGNMLGAMTAYDAAIAILPDFPDAYNNKANALASIQRFADAIPMFNKAIELKPDAPNFRCNRGLAKHAMGDLQGACADWQQAAMGGYSPANSLVQQYCK
ncbi:MAG: tetratricopeptide repeat protein [Saprospiraceae bacterium]|nr:tetratricopeptide repeat protein [Saprospiraceae bacterium]